MEKINAHRRANSFQNLNPGQTVHSNIGKTRET